MRKRETFKVYFTRSGMLQSMFRVARTSKEAVRATRKALKGATGVTAEKY